MEEDKEKEALKEKKYTCTIKSFETWADPEDFERELEQFNASNKGVLEANCQEAMDGVFSPKRRR